jgi:hypothetical protein
MIMWRLTVRFQISNRTPRLPGFHSCGLTCGGAADRQTSVCSASSSASSTSTPKYRTVFSILVWPRSRVLAETRDPRILAELGIGTVRSPHVERWMMTVLFHQL